MTIDPAFVLLAGLGLIIAVTFGLIAFDIRALRAQNDVLPWPDSEELPNDLDACQALINGLEALIDDHEHDEFGEGPDEVGRALLAMLERSDVDRDRLARLIDTLIWLRDYPDLDDPRATAGS